MKYCKLFNIILVAAYILTASTTLMAAELKLAADEWPPFTSERKGQRIAVDLVQTALRRADFDSTLKIMTWKNVLNGIKGNQYDAVVGAWKTPDREQYLLFSRPYLQNRIKLIGLRDKPIEFYGLSQLNNKKVAVVTGYAYGDKITNNRDMILVEGNSVADNIKKLLANQVDFMLADDIAVQAINERLPADVTKKLMVYDKDIVTRDLYFALRKNRPDAQNILDKFNHAIEKMIADGTYNQILGFTWLLADTNSDGVYEYIAGSNLSAAVNDPEKQQNSYNLFADESAQKPSGANAPDLSKKPLLKYRVLNQEYNTWNEAKQAIDEAVEQGVSPHEDTSGTFDFSIGKF